MKREIINDLVKWKNRSDRKPLILLGARQVGKSFAIRKYAQSHYEHYIEINFLENTQAVSLLQNVSDVKDLLVRLSAISQKVGGGE